jgi:hypothetical protein
MIKCMSQKRCWPWFSRWPGTTSPKLVFWLTGLHLWWSERDKGQKTPWFNWRVKGVNLGLSSV